MEPPLVICSPTSPEHQQSLAVAWWYHLYCLRCYKEWYHQHMILTLAEVVDVDEEQQEGNKNICTLLSCVV